MLKLDSKANQWITELYRKPVLKYDSIKKQCLNLTLSKDSAKISFYHQPVLKFDSITNDCIILTLRHASA